MDAKNLICDYFKESQGYDLFTYKESGFVFYRALGPEFHIAHYYISPEERKKGHTSQVGAALEEIARNKGCTYLSCIVTQEKGKEAIQSRLVKIYLDFGFKIMITNDRAIIMAKDIK